MSGMAEFFYNGKDGTVLGRTFDSWVKIGFFYLVYYTLLGFLAYGTIGWYQSTVEDSPVPYIRTRTGQPGMAVEPANGVIADNNNQNFEFNINVESSYKPYIDRSIDFLKAYGSPTTEQFSREMLNKAVSEDRSMYFFIKVNKVNGWLPIGYKSQRQMVAEGYFHLSCDDDGSNCKEVPAITFDRENQMQTQDGVYFYCNSTSPEVNFEFTSLADYNVQLMRPDTKVNTYGFIAKNEYEKLNEGFKVRRKWDAIGSLTAPFVPVKISWGNAVGKISVQCFTMAQNIQVQRHIWVGFYEFGFTPSNLGA